MKGFQCIVMLLPLVPLWGFQSPARDPLGLGAWTPTFTGTPWYEGKNLSTQNPSQRNVSVGACTLVGVQGPIWRCDGRRIEEHWCTACLEYLPICVGWCLLGCECKWTAGWYCENSTNPVWCPYGEHCSLIE